MVAHTTVAGSGAQNIQKRESSVCSAWRRRGRGKNLIAFLSHLRDG